MVKKLKALKSQNKDLKIYIKGDKKLNYGKVMDLMSFINKSGFKKVALVTKLNNKNDQGLLKSMFLHTGF